MGIQASVVIDFIVFNEGRNRGITVIESYAILVQIYFIVIDREYRGRRSIVVIDVNAVAVGRGVKRIIVNPYFRFRTV